ncbi:MAG: bifunctional 4-hydroxy-2-oxoglutarate aldolase/2-dehydro-3-deoxy-phosphogluconate aldolase [Ignavibacteriales bacterium]|nr:bifunctional 4-hydroxy-2-oxoglutarate aldolase/2-dehydro-3-deoxy-phosphogluconate aldolase [Ignavibacteriales bacterium]
MGRVETLNKLFQSKVVAVIRMQDPEKLISVAEALYEGGISFLEVTMTTPQALEVIAAASKKLPNEIVIGVGSVLDAQTARMAIYAGARFVVSPVFKPELILTSHRYDVAVMTGAFTPTEILTAFETGADVVKVFPADVTGMEFFKSVLAPMPFLKLMPTGGVSLTNGGDWIKAGACAVGVGSALIDKKLIEAGDYAGLTAKAKTLVQSVNNG